jgi:hypothetical protein
MLGTVEETRSTKRRKLSSIIEAQQSGTDPETWEEVRKLRKD